MVQARLFSVVVAAQLVYLGVDAFTTPTLFSLRKSPVSISRNGLQLSQANFPVTRARNDALQLSMNKQAQGGMSLKYTTADGVALSYDYMPGTNPTVVFLPGLNQTRIGSKAVALQTWCKRNKQGYFTADYYGCGKSEGLYKDGTISRWVSDTVKFIDEVIKGPVLLVGAGVGGWVMMHVALQRPQKVKGLIGMAADPDFTTDVVMPVLDEKTKRQIRETGLADIQWGVNKYTLSQKLIDDSQKLLLLKGGPKSVPIKCPVRLIQGLGDEEIPPKRALKISEVLATEDLVLTYFKYGDHGLDEEEELEHMTGEVADLCAKGFDFDLTSPTSG